MRFLPRVSLILCFGLVAFAQSVPAGEMYVGTYTYFLGSRGIYHFHFDPETGAVSGGELAAKTSNPSFLAVRPGGRNPVALLLQPNQGGGHAADSRLDGEARR